ncbi:MAG: hypothetical protein A3J66_01650 [Candidatus Magasanikbacteria bacterium RIFCSPHIGHO2_02_FULL_47_14]|uniref:Uncharacterized protein n=1 Tax=Candidatus Magasanikbacteria bacterium RIFCSPHIGHO2_02_FULL_47_14 TaxID=1798680 RepID=A0A1F6LYU6_9BACT|nr:MAG: hypothetical protein A3J66_01650 [Candidatus Magasanikbacteria bacterium RIFCSPHIGHO2_02_FULL_47_14]
MKQKISFPTLALLAISVMSVVPALAFAKGNLQDAAKTLDSKTIPQTGLGESEPGLYIGTVINAALTLVGLIFLVLMVYAGYLWMTARGESEQIDKARQIITASIIGLVIVLSAYAISTFVTGRFEG